MKKLIFLGLLTWFFGVKTTFDNYPGAFMQSIVGPFKTEKDCISNRDKMQDVLDEAYGAGEFTFTKCIEKQEV